MGYTRGMFRSYNPATEEVLKEYEEISASEINERLSRAVDAQKAWAATPFSARAKPMKKLAELFRSEKEAVGKLITLEIGRPITASIAESEKCAWACDYFADHAEKMLAPEALPESLKGEVRFDPLGVVLAVMPWNYPFWQAVRFLAPALMAGNAAVLKHASNVPQSAEMLETLIRDAGFPEGLFQNLYVSSKNVGSLIDDERIAAVTLTGSVTAGASVAERAGKNIKKLVLELGGSDPFIVLEDANVAEAAKAGALARLQNAGQSCIASKRFLVHEAVYDEFVKAFVSEFEKYAVGDPMNPETNVGTVVSEDALKELLGQIERSVAAGAKIAIGGKRKDGIGAYLLPTILTGVTKGMPAYDEEIFGPVAAVIKVKDADEAVSIANDSEFGLSSSVWTRDIEKAKNIAVRIHAGGVFINAMTKSDPRLPFGGVKKSGYGRELSEFGIREFVNVKTVSIA